MSKGVLVVDVQVFQTAAWHRGMGKYSAALLSALEAKNFFGRYSKVCFVSNNKLNYEDEAKSFVEELRPDAVHIGIDFDVPTASTKSIKKIQDTNRKKLDNELTNQGLIEYDYLILSLFLDETCAVFPSIGKKLLLFYDLIPFLFPERYKARINYQGYLDHFSTIFQADVVFNISETVANDNHVYLGLPQRRLVNIDGASIDRSKLSAQKPKIDIPQHTILMPSGDELRKNNLRAVKGFEEFNARHNNKYSLVITSRFSDYSKKELSAYSDKLIFTGNVKEEELQWIYEHAEVVLFPSEYEGLGLPILEAMSAGKRIACSEIPVFKEISPESFYFFDELSTSSIAGGLSAAVEGAGWPEKKASYDDLLKEYSWGRTAEKFIEGYDRCVVDSNKVAKPKIAITTPHPAGYSAIGKVVAESHAEYSKYFDIEYFYDYGPYHREVRPDFLSHIAKTYDISEFNAERYGHYDAVIYHIGNSDYHLGSIRNALYLPGYVIMHDTYLDGAFESLLATGRITTQRYNVEKKLNSELEGASFLTSLLSNQLGVITHSQYAAKVAVDIVGKSSAVKEVALPVSTPNRSKRGNKERGALQIGLAGIIADVKGLDIIAKLATTSTFDDCTIHVFGHSFAKPEIEREFKKWPNVKVVTDPTDFEFQTKLNKLDVLVNYRLEYRGETSLTTLEAMRYGVPVIVRSDVGWYSELPNDAVVKASSTSDVLEKVELLKLNARVAYDISRSAIEYTGSKHTHALYAQELAEVIKKKSPLSEVVSFAKHMRQDRKSVV